VAAGLKQRRQGYASPLDLGQGLLPPSRSLTSGPDGVLIARDISVRRWVEASPQHAKGDAGTQEGLRGATMPMTRTKALASVASWAAAACSRAR
jgi:hypothetical protein